MANKLRNYTINFDPQHPAEDGVLRMVLELDGGTVHVEMRYDETEGRMIYQPVTIEPREITPRVVREEHYGGQ